MESILATSSPCQSFSSGSSEIFISFFLIFS